LLLLSAALPASAASVELRTFVPAADTVIYFDGVDGAPTATASNALGENLSVGQDAGGVLRRSLLRFDVSNILPGSIVQAVELKVFETRSRGDYGVSLHRVLKDWGEGASNGGTAGASGVATDGDATWLRARVPDVAWDLPGGDFVATASATTNVGAASAYYTWSSVQMAIDVQSWIDAPATNHGWIMIGLETVNQLPKLFGSGESAVAPVLSVHVTPVPEPAVFLMMSLGLGLVAWRLRMQQR